MEFQRAKEADFEGKWIPQPAQEKDLAELAAMIFDSELGRKYYPTEKTLLEKMQAACQNSDRIMVVREKEKICRHVMVSDEGGIWHVPVPASYFYPGLYEGKRRGTGADALS